MTEAAKAIAVAKLGRLEEAEAALARSRSLALAMAAPESGDLGADWKEWYEIDLGQTRSGGLCVHTLTREAAERVDLR